MDSFTTQDLLRQDEWLRRAARAIVRDPGIADDLAQDAWVAALRRRRGKDADRPWMRGIVLRSFQAGLRRARNARAREREVEAPLEAPSAAEVVEQIDLRRRVATALLELDEPFRTALHLHFVVGDPFRTIARKTNVSVSTAKGRCDKGVARLRKALEVEGEGDRRAQLRALAVAALPAATGVSTGAKVGAAAALALCAGVAWVGGHNLLSDRGTSEELARAESDRVAGLDDSPPAARARDGEPASSENRGVSRAVAGDESEALDDTEVDASPPEVAGQTRPTPTGDTATITATLVLPDGKPASGTWTLLSWPVTSGGLTPEEAAAITATKEGTLDAHGYLEVAFSRNAGLQYALEARVARGASHQWRWSDGELTDVVDLGRVTLDATAELTGRLTSATGGPPPSGDHWLVDASWAAPGTDGRDGKAGPVVADPSTGAFALDGVLIGPVEISVRGARSGPWSSERVEVLGGVNEPLEISLPAVVQETRVQLAASREHVRMGAIRVEPTDLLLIDGAGRRWESSRVPGRTSLYYFPGAPAESGTILLEDPRFLPLKKESVLRGTGVTLRVTGSTSVRPRVLDASGRELASYRLEVREGCEPRTHRDRTALLAEGDALPDGVVCGLTPGDYRFFATVDGATGHVDVAGLEPGEVREVEITVRELHAVTGIVRRPDGAPAVGDRVRLVVPAAVRDSRSTRILPMRTRTSAMDRFRWLVASTRVDAEGRFELEAPEEGTYIVLVGDHAGTSVETKPFELEHDGDPVELSLVLEAGGFIKGVVNVPGVPSPTGWSLIAGQSTAFNSLDRARNPASATLDHNGEFRLGPLPGGPIDLYLLEPRVLNGSALFWAGRGGAEPLSNVTVVDGKTVTVKLDVPTDPIATVTPQVTVPVNPHPWYRVTLILVDAPSGRPSFSSNDDGGRVPPIYAIPGEYRVLVTSESWTWRRPENLVLAAGERLTLPLDVELHHRRLRLVDADGSPITDTAWGHPATDERGWGLQASFILKTDEDGFVEVALGRGTYSISVHGEREWAATFDWPLQEGETELVLD